MAIRPRPVPRVAALVLALGASAAWAGCDGLVGIQEGVLDGLLPREVQELEQALHQVQSNWQALFALSRKEADCA